MKKALARHKQGKARVIPIILHPCGWLRTPLQVLQGVSRDNKAISLWANEHAALDHVVSEIAKVVDDLRRSKTAAERVEQASAVAVAASTSSPSRRPSPARGRGRFRRRCPNPSPACGRGRCRPNPSPARGRGRARDSGRVRAKETPVPKDGIYIGVDPRKLPDFAVFKDVDAPWCPEMVVIPAGQFRMGSPKEEKERQKSEGPQRQVTIGHRFALGRYAVRLAEYATFAEATRRSHEGEMYVWTGTEWKKDTSKSWRDPGFAQTDRHPVVGVSWQDAQAYVEWLSRRGKPIACRARRSGSMTARAAATTPFSSARQ